MTHDIAAIAAGARREMARNIALAPIVLLIRLPLALIYLTLAAMCEALEWVVCRLPGWRVDYTRLALRAHLERNPDAQD